MSGSNKIASEKWGVEYVNADVVSPNFVPKMGRRWEKSTSVKDVAIKNRKGRANRNKHKSAARPSAFKPFAQTNADKMKKKAKENTVGDVSKNAA